MSTPERVHARGAIHFRCGDRRQLLYIYIYKGVRTLCSFSIFLLFLTFFIYIYFSFLNVPNIYSFIFLTGLYVSWSLAVPFFSKENCIRRRRTLMRRYRCDSTPFPQRRISGDSSSNESSEKVSLSWTPARPSPMGGGALLFTPVATIFRCFSSTFGDTLTILARASRRMTSSNSRLFSRRFTRRHPVPFSFSVACFPSAAVVKVDHVSTTSKRYAVK